MTQKTKSLTEIDLQVLPYVEYILNQQRKDSIDSIIFSYFYYPELFEKDGLSMLGQVLVNELQELAHPYNERRFKSHVGQGTNGQFIEVY